MKSREVRQKFMDFFKSRQHKIVPSAPMVVKDDPTLMFTNAGMNQFKDIFLGNKKPVALRVADTQKCLRVSGKHNDLEEVGHDTYHHTMFEMLGNWSFGDYFKKEAIGWAWELLTGTYGIAEDRLYVTVFEGDSDDNIPPDDEAYKIWESNIPSERILYGNKKDNFWEMGDTGPCGPCSEIHVDLRDEGERNKIPGSELVNRDHPEVIEIWNLVFIEFNRKAGGKLEPLPQKHVDTGMGFERLTMVLQGKTSNYDTDIFTPIIDEISKIAGISYRHNEETMVAMRVIADHLRAVSFAIADGQLPSNTGAGYVIRRILRRAIRYGFTFLNMNEPFVFSLVPVLTREMGDFFPELKKQQDLISRVMNEEESSFLKTLSQGIRRFEAYISDHKGNRVIDGKFAFELFDTYGFPLDLTRLMAGEKGWSVDLEGFNEGLEAQKNRSRSAAETDTQDWHILKQGVETTEFVGYEFLEAEVEIVKYRKVKTKKENFYEIVLTRTPFYAEAGGQVGDRGWLARDGEKLRVLDTYKENELFIHKTDKVFAAPEGSARAIVDMEKRLATVNNHSATHLMHAALRKVLGDHVEQRGSLVDEHRLRFDFSHFSRMSEEEIRQVERLVNEKVRENIPIDEKREVPFKEALEMGAMALFGEKYGDDVRVITFDPEYSVELCGGTHVRATGQIGLFKIVSEGAIAAGIRRIEAVTGAGAEEFVESRQDIIRELNDVLKNTKDLVKGVKDLVSDNKELQKKLESMNRRMALQRVDELLERASEINGTTFIAEEIDGGAGEAKDTAFALKNKADNLFVVLGTSGEGKAGLTILISEKLVKENGLHAGNIIREIAKEIEGGGGGQPHFASAGGKNPEGISKAIAKARKKVEEATGGED